jgi:hypothetical protein
VEHDGGVRRVKAGWEGGHKEWIVKGRGRGRNKNKEKECEGKKDKSTMFISHFKKDKIVELLFIFSDQELASCKHRKGHNLERIYYPRCKAEYIRGKHTITKKGQTQN